MTASDPLLRALRGRAEKHGGDALLVEAADEIESLRADRDRSQITTLVDIRYAVGDDGKRMQAELVEYIKGIVAERDRLRERIEQYQRFEMFVVGEGAWARFLALEEKIFGHKPLSDDYKNLVDRLKRNRKVVEED